MFNMSMGVGEHVVRGVAVYVFLFLLLRFVGKKHVGELAPFDLLVLLILSETVQNSLVGDDTSLIGGLISASTLVLCAYGISFLRGDTRTLWSIDPVYGITGPITEGRVLINTAT